MGSPALGKVQLGELESVVVPSACPVSTCLQWPAEDGPGLVGQLKAPAEGS